jgi:hypothetical protein
MHRQPGVALVVVVLCLAEPQLSSADGWSNSVHDLSEEKVDTDGKKICAAGENCDGGESYAQSQAPPQSPKRRRKAEKHYKAALQAGLLSASVLSDKLVKHLDGCISYDPAHSECAFFRARDLLKLGGANAVRAKKLLATVDTARLRKEVCQRTACQKTGGGSVTNDPRQVAPLDALLFLAAASKQCGDDGAALDAYSRIVRRMDGGAQTSL